MQFANPNILFLVLLFLHIGGAIVAFGPTFAFPVIGAAGGREPQHAGFAVRVSEAIAKQRVTPVAIWVGVTGVLLILVSGRNPAELWLSLAILLYVIALTFSFLVVAPNAARLVEATRTPPPPPAPGAAPPAGPPPHIAELIAKSKRYGMILGLFVIAILALMVLKPTL
jgi:uncharacterized membrane protein